MANTNKVAVRPFHPGPRVIRGWAVESKPGIGGLRARLLSRLAGWIGLPAVLLGLIPCGYGTPVPKAEDEPPVTKRDLPRIKPTEPDQALATFQIAPGFAMDLVAAEPLVQDPVAMAFDEYGRLFVVEMRGYSENRAGHAGRIKVLWDSDGDGRFESGQTYLDGLAWPTAIACYDGGVFIGATPDIWYCKDLDGDLRADVKRLVYTGFAARYRGGDGDWKRLNVQAMMSSFRWGLDNRIHGETGGSGGSVVTVCRPGLPPINVYGKDFSFDPKTLEIRPESGGAQHGLSFDGFGREFVCSNSDHLQMVTYAERYAEGSTLDQLPPERVSIADDGPAAPVYRISPDEPWRVIRTRWRVAGAVSGPIEGGGRPSGYFTAATGVTIYRGDAWPAADRGQAIVADCGSNLIHRKELYRKGVFFGARRLKEDTRKEFVASRDNWFRPVQFANGPDGNLYVADMYREVIEHPWSLPENIKRFLDLNSGNNRGRIYRIRARGRARDHGRRLGGAAEQELVKNLEHPNGWNRETAARLLYQIHDRRAIARVERLFYQTKSPEARIRALQVLRGLGGLTSSQLIRGMRDSSPGVRRFAIRLLETLRPDALQGKRLIETVKERAVDASAEVRFQLALTLSAIEVPGELEALRALAMKDAGSRWIGFAVRNAAGKNVLDLAKALGTAAGSSGDPKREAFSRRLLQDIGFRGAQDELGPALDWIQSQHATARVIEDLQALGKGLRLSNRSIETLLGPARLERWMRAAGSIARDGTAANEARLLAVGFLGQISDATPALVGLWKAIPAIEIRKAMVASLGWKAREGLVHQIIADWTTLPSQIRRQATELFAMRASSARQLLSQIKEGTISKNEVTITAQRRLAHQRDPAIQHAVQDLFARKNRQDIEEKEAFFRDALLMKADPERGRTVFVERCAQCHQAGQTGVLVGPPLASVKGMGKAGLLTQILDPNRLVPPEYEAYEIETKGGETWLGLVVSETNRGLTLRSAGGEEKSFSWEGLRAMKPAGLSLMPEGLAEGLDQQAMADLLEFIVTQGQ